MTTIIETTATESANEPVTEETQTETSENGAVKRALGWTKSHTVDPVVGVTTGAATVVKGSWLKHRAYSAAKDALKQQMTAEGLEILAAERAAKEAEKEAARLAKEQEKDDEIRTLTEQLAKLQDMVEKLQKD